MSGNTEELNVALSGRYRIERQLGAGGMATVYLAQDVRHDRKVAVKVLRPELSAILGAQRFLTEIKTTANLQHPHILSLFDSGEADGTVFYVMPYVEGETLRDRIKREHQLPIEEAVRIAREVLDALEYAHKQGIVHRDIKPENILLHGGHAMVADFGIALAASRTDGKSRMTETGMSLGTPHYMSPEQAMGEREITPKADIYALGAVLYEMLTGEPPFTGATAQAIFARVLTDEPRSLTLQRKTIPPHIADAVNVALQKLPADRFATASEFGAVLSGAEVRSPGMTSAATSRRASTLPRRNWRTIGIGVAAGVAIGAAGLATVSSITRVAEAPPREIQFTLSLPDSARYSDAFGRSIAVSPDGSAIVYPGGTTGRRYLFIRRLNEQKPSAIPGTEGAYLPFFSPTGEWLGFVANQRLMKVRLAGGTPVEVAQLLGNTASGATWSPDDVIALEDVTGLSRVNASGGQLTVLTGVDSVNTTLTWPWFLPSGDAVLCSVARADGVHIGVVTLSDGRLTVFDDIRGTDPRYMEPGYLVWASNEGALLAAPFDQRALRPTGPPVALRQGIIIDSDGAKMSVGPGIFVSVEGGAQRARLLRLDRRGVARVERPEDLDYSTPRFSPDGGRIAVLVGSGGLGGELWVLDRVKGTRQRLALDASANWVEWSLDGRTLVFGYIPARSWDIYSAPADGSGKPVRVVATDQTELPAGWAPGGKFVFWRATQKRGDILYLDSIDGAEHEFAATNAEEAAPTLSPDGRWLAYVSDNSAGQREVYVRPFPTGDGRWQISADGGIEPRWSKNGREIIYRDGDLFLAVPIVAGPGISTGTVDTLFRAPYATFTRRASYDVTRDGMELTIVGAESADRTISVTINPFPELFGRRPKQ